MGQWEKAAQLFIDSRNYKKAIEIYTTKNHMSGLIEVCRQMDKDANKNEL